MAEVEERLFFRLMVVRELTDRGTQEEAMGVIFRLHLIRLVVVVVREKLVTTRQYLFPELVVTGKNTLNLQA